MKLFTAAVFALTAFVSADVSHLSNHYLPPSIQSHSGSSFQASVHSSRGGAAVVPSTEYLPVLQHTNSAPDQAYAGHVEHTYTAPVQTYSAPAVQTYSAPVSYSVPTVQQSYSSAPSSEYLPPGSHSHSYSVPAPPPVIQTYSVPATSYSTGSLHSHSSPAVLSHQPFSAPSVGIATSSVDAGTQYASNGGYVYRKK